MRKEYNDRWTAPLVNPPITLGEYEHQRQQSEKECLHEGATDCCGTAKTICGLRFEKKEK